MPGGSLRLGVIRTLTTAWDLIAISAGMLSMARLSMAAIDEACLPGWLREILWDWDELADWLFSGFHVLFVKLAELIAEVLNLQIVFQDHWKYAAMMIWIYSMKDATNAWEGDWHGHKKTAIIRAAWGIGLALLAGFVSGFVPVTSPYAALLLSGSVVLALFAYRVAYAVRFVEEMKWENANRGASHNLQKILLDKLVIALGVLGVGVLIVLLATYARSVPIVQSFSDPTLASLILIILALTLFHVVLAVRNTNLRRKADQPWMKAFLSQGNFKLSRMIGPSLLGSFVVTVFNQCPL